MATEAITNSILTEPTVVPATTTQDEVAEDFPHIRENQNVLIHMPSGNVKIVNLKRNTKISLGKFGSFQSDKLIDKPFGLSYEICDQEGNIRPIRNWALSAVEETNANNQTIVDNKANQKLTYEEVEKLKQEGLKGTYTHEEIIQKIVESHVDFDKKTEYSKAKYIQRKKKKFMKVFTPVRPTLYSIAEYFFTKNPDKIRNIRIDTLSQMLSFANVHANSKILVVDDTQGLIVAAVAERMGGYGTIVGIHEGQNHNYDILRYMNFSKRILDTIHTVPLSKLDPEEPDDAWTDKPEEHVGEMTEQQLRAYQRRQRIAVMKVESRKLLFEGNFDGLLISSQYSPESVIKKLYPLLSGSRPIVVYSLSKENLLEAAWYMRNSRDFLNADITESSLRRYQVLPGRTHPEMNMSAGGGYLLSALRVIDCPDEMSLVVQELGGRRGKKRKGAKVNKDAPSLASTDAGDGVNKNKEKEEKS